MQVSVRDWKRYDVIFPTDRGFLIRRFLELTRTNKIKALEFLQSGFRSLINPNNAEQEEQLQSLATFLFSETEIEYDKQRSEKEKTHRHRKRCELFETLCGFFPESMIQPKENLVDMISL